MSKLYIGNASQHLAWDIFQQNTLMPLNTWVGALNSSDVTEKNRYPLILHTDLVPYTIAKTKKIAQKIMTDLSEVVDGDDFQLSATVKKGKLASDSNTTVLVADLHGKQVSGLQVVFWWPNTKVLIDELKMSVSKFESLVMEAKTNKKTVRPAINFSTAGQTLEISRGTVTESQSYHVSLSGKGDYKLPDRFNYAIYHTASTGIVFLNTN